MDLGHVQEGGEAAGYLAPQRLREGTDVAGFNHLLLPVGRKRPLALTLAAFFELPALDEFRNFCFSPQTTLEPILSDIFRFSVA
jgi:hypothetical protein